MRTQGEIAAWQAMNDLAKRAVWKQLPQRRAQWNAARLDR